MFEGKLTEKITVILENEDQEMGCMTGKLHWWGKRIQGRNGRNEKKKFFFITTPLATSKASRQND